MASERETVSRYVAFLEEFGVAWRAQAPTASEGNTPSGSEVPAGLRTSSGGIGCGDDGAGADESQDGSTGV